MIRELTADNTNSQVAVLKDQGLAQVAHYEQLQGQYEGFYSDVQAAAAKDALTPDEFRVANQKIGFLGEIADEMRGLAGSIVEKAGVVQTAGTSYAEGVPIAEVIYPDQGVFSEYGARPAPAPKSGNSALFLVAAAVAAFFILRWRRAL